MLSLKPPATAKAEDAVIIALTRRRLWSPFTTHWTRVYARYRRYRGNPWLIFPDPMFKPAKKRLAGLYKRRSAAGTLALTRRARGLDCCAMCGSHHNGTLDHYLPKAEYPEYAILPSNLVPACTHCNSGVKGVSVKGATPVERYFHPYFDKAARHPLWRATITAPYPAATFTAVPLPHFGARRRRQVAFHLKGVTGEVFEDYCAKQFGNLPEAVRIRIGPAPTESDFKAEIRTRLKEHQAMFGINAWMSGLLRGVLSDPAAMTYLRSLV